MTRQEQLKLILEATCVLQKQDAILTDAAELNYIADDLETAAKDIRREAEEIMKENPNQ